MERAVDDVAVACDSILPPHSISENMIYSKDTNVKQIQSVLFPTSPRKSYSAESFLNSSYLKYVNYGLQEQELSASERASSLEYLKVKDSRDLYPKELSPLDQVGQAPRWPTECQVLEERVRHIQHKSCPPEPYYSPTNTEIQPRPVGEESGIIIYQYYPISAVNYFCRSSIGGSQYLLPTCPSPEVDGLRFESRFESGNLAKAIKITASYYELYLRTDLYTNRHMQWYYFRVTNMKKGFVYRFSIVNFLKPDSLYCEGMKPLMYSEKDAQLHSVGWRRCGDNITYFSNESVCGEDQEQLQYYTLTFTLEFPHDDDTVYLAHSYPYTYSDLQDHLLSIVAHPVKSTYTTLRLLCKTLAGNNVYYVTITTPPTMDTAIKKKRAIVITARVHPGETPSSWMMHGFLDFLTSETGPAKELRDNFIFKLVPMLNPDGVIVGNNRCSLTGKDLNRQYRTVIRETYPSIWYTKLMIRRLMEECGVAMYCDLHAHSKKHNIFIFGCENRRGSDRKLQEQVFPLMLHKNAADKFSFEGCKFRIQRCKEGTGRVVMWMMGIQNSFTMEASFGGSRLSSRSETHFTPTDFEQMGRTFCQTLLDFYDEDPRKERLRQKIICRLAKEGSSADEPANIDLSDYSSDGGDTTTSSDDENFAGMRTIRTMTPTAPPPSPTKPRMKALQPKIKLSKLKYGNRKPMPVCKPSFGYNWKQRTSSQSCDTSSSSGSDSESNKEKIRPVRRKKKKKRKKTAKKNATSSFDATFCGVDYAVIDLIPDGKLGLPPSKKTPPSVRHSNDGKRLSNLHRLSEVQAKLQALKYKLWFGTGDVSSHRPLSWGPPNCTAPKTDGKKASVSEKRKTLKKSKTKEEPIRLKKNKECLKRQPALELAPPILKGCKVLRSRSLTDALKENKVKSAENGAMIEVKKKSKKSKMHKTAKV